MGALQYFAAKMADLDVSKMKVAELRAALLERGLDTKGVKAILQERLITAMSEDAESPAPASIEEEDGAEQEEQEQDEEQDEEEEDAEQLDEVAQEATESFDQLVSRKRLFAMRVYSVLG